MWFAAGFSDKSGENLNAEGEQIFLNAVTFLTNPPSPGAASSPNPANGADDVISTAILTWEPGEFPGTHDVFFGETLFQ
jgi:hypothetical protein